MKPRLLIVDDNQMLVKTLRVYLGRQGWQVDTACCGAEARERLRAAIPDLGLFDLRLPDTHGLDLLAGMRWRGLRMPVVVMSAERHQEWLRQAVDCSAAAYLCKPFALSTLARVLNCALAGLHCIPACAAPERCTAPSAHLLRPR